MRSRKVVAGFMAAVTCLALVACGGTNRDNGATTGKLSFYTNKAAWKSDFNELNSQSKGDVDISLKTTGYSDEEQYEAFIKQSFRTKKSPGLFTWQTGPSLRDLVDDHLVAETTDIWDSAIKHGWISKDLRSQYTFHGKQYCVPMNIAYWVMYYNKKTFAKYDLKEPTTWAQLDGIAKKLKSKGVTPYYQTSTLFTFPWFQQLVAGTDPKLYNGLATGKVKYTDSRIVDIMNTWRDQEKKGWFSDPGSKTDPAVGLKQNDFAMINFGSFFNGSLDGAGMKSGKDYGMFTIPAVNPSLKQTPIAMESGPLCVAASSEQKTLGLTYSKWWMSPDAQTAWSKARGDVAFNPKAKVADPMLADLGDQVETKKYQRYDRYYEATPTPILTVALEQFGAFIANPGDPKPYLKKIQAEADKYWAKRK